MPVYHSILFDGETVKEEPSKHDFLRLRKAIFTPEDEFTEKGLETIVYRIAEQPRNLVLHLQRIFVCYQQEKTDQLYAALVDFLTILAGKGRSLAKRMVNGASGILGENQLANLRSFLSGQQPRGHLQANEFCVLAIDLMGTLELVTKASDNETEHDYLKLAHDYIEYSQLDSAMELLEGAMNNSPAREDLQKQLLELYRVTESDARFKGMYEVALNQNLHLISDWKELDDYFNGRKK